MQQELWLRARAQVFSSLSSVCAMRAASDPHPHPLRTTEGGQISGSYPSGVPNGIAGAGDAHPHHHHPHGPPFHSSPRPGHGRSRTSGHTLAHANSHHHHHHHRDAAGGDALPEGFQLLHNPPKVVRSHQELHKELLLAHKKDLVVGSRPELHMVLERRKKEQSQRQEEEEAKGPLEHVLLKRQQKHEENAREEEERIRDEAQLSEFVRVRQNLRKIHSALQSKTTNS